jgi:hypothetical protein
MSCPADFAFLENGLVVTERLLQSDGQTIQFFPYRAIQTVRYNHSRGERSTISIWILGNGSPGAGGISYRYSFPCETGKNIFEKLISMTS